MHDQEAPSLDLPAALDLLQRHHRQNRPTMYRDTPSTPEWHSLWPRLRSIRAAATAGNAEASAWLATHGDTIRAVEACREHDLNAAITYRGPGKR